MLDTITGPLTGRTPDASTGKPVTPKDTVKAPAKATKKAAEKKEPAKAPAKATGKKITLVAKKCPSKAGTTRAKRWAKLKTGMTLAAAQEVGIPMSYLKRMVSGGHLKIA